MPSLGSIQKREGLSMRESQNTVRRLNWLVALAALTSLQPALAAKSHELPTAKAEKVGMSTERLNTLTNGMKSIVDEGKLAGVVTMVARHGKVVHFVASGKSDIAKNTPMQKDSIFRIYSMSKPITGVAMMMLFEEGKWQLNDPVSKYIPEFANLKVYSGVDGDKPILRDQVSSDDA
jgi:CubicO group peptidase (beta-lactamase class C family)